MLHPSYKEMIEKVNETQVEGERIIHSRYTLVIAAAKRARQINAGSEPMVATTPMEKNLSIAVDEMFHGNVHVINDDEAVEAIETAAEVEEVAEI